MKVRILLFGPARLSVDQTELFLDLFPQARVCDAVNKLLRDYPPLQKLENCLRYAVDMEYVGLETSLCEGQTLALIPPVQGG